MTIGAAGEINRAIEGGSGSRGGNGAEGDRTDSEGGVGVEAETRAERASAEGEANRAIEGGSGSRGGSERLADAQALQIAREIPNATGCI